MGRRYPHSEPHYPTPHGSEVLRKYGPSRRGVVPVPRSESPQDRRERLDRLRQDHLKKTLEIEKSSRFETYDLGNKSLPIYEYKDEIKHMIAKNRVSQLCGETGSGKTTQLAQYAVEAGFDRVVYLMPRRSIVDNVTTRLEYELQSRLEDDYPEAFVGKAHSEAHTTSDDSAIQVMTAGTFSRMIEGLRNDWRDEKVLIVADEIHEANLEMEFATALAAQTIDQNDNWHLTLSTATPDPVAAEAYRGINEDDSMPTITIPTRPHDLETIEDSDGCVDDAYEKYGSESKKTLIFVEGKRAINDTISALRRQNDSPTSRIRFLKFHANVSEGARKEIFTQDPPEGERWVIVATSAAQSGITIPGVDLVISNGLTKSPELDEEGDSGLPTRLCTQAELKQQGGRAGRDIAGGRFVLSRPVKSDRSKYRGDELHTFASINSRDMYMPPEIYNTNISRNVLRAIASGSDFEELNDYMIHGVSNKTIEESYDVLESLGAIMFDEDDHVHATIIGKKMDEFPLRPELARSAYEAMTGKYSTQVKAAFVAIASCIEAKGLARYDTQQNGDSWMETISDETDDDFIAEYDMFLKSRQFYWRSYDGEHVVDEKELAKLGYEPKNVKTANKSFNKIMRMFGLDQRDVDMAPLTIDEKNQVHDILLAGMPDLIYEYVGSSTQGGSRQISYKNKSNGEQALERTLSDRSVTLKRMGKKAVKYVAGYGWWYDTESGVRHSVIEKSMPVTKERLDRAIGKMASKQVIGSRVLNGDLVNISQAKWGSMVNEKVQYETTIADSREKISALVDAVAKEKPYPYDILQQAGIPQKTIREIVERAANNSHSVGEVEGKMWAIIQEQLNEQQLDLFNQALTYQHDA